MRNYIEIRDRIKAALATATKPLNVQELQIEADCSGAEINSVLNDPRSRFDHVFPVTKQKEWFDALDYGKDKGYGRLSAVG